MSRMLRWVLMGFLLATSVGCKARADEQRRRIPLAQLQCQGVTANGLWQSTAWPSFVPSGGNGSGDGDGGGTGDGAGQQAEADRCFNTNPACTWLEYPKGNVLLEVEHSLTRAPTSVLVYVSFDRRGCASTLAAGDATQVIEATDRTVMLRNNTDQDFFARIVLQ